MRSIYWFEAKQLDEAINFSSRTEIIKRGIKRGIDIKYYCSFRSTKKDYGLPNNIRYLGFFKQRILKRIEFCLLVMLKSIQIVITKKGQVIVVNQFAIRYIMPALFLSKLAFKRNKFIVDIRTTPVTPETFEKDMKAVHRQFRMAIKHFDGLSFITPFMAEYMMSRYDKKLPVVYWSSGVDIQLFNYSNCLNKKENSSAFKIFYHGSINVSRGNLDLIKACEKLIEQGINLQLTQVGVLGEEVIRRYIEDHKLSSWCTLLPKMPIEKIPQLIAESDLPVLPFPYFMAWRVSSPIKLMEYLAMGKKVLAPDIEAFTDVFKEHSHLIHYYNSQSDNQIEEIANKIAEIIRLWEVENFNSNEAVEFVKEHYAWEMQADKLLNYCLSL